MLIPRFLRTILELRQSGLAQLIVLGDTLHSWSEEIARMWRFTRSNGITEGYHNKMETISRQAYGFRNFENYRQRVQVLCSSKVLGLGSAPVFGVQPRRVPKSLVFSVRMVGPWRLERQTSTVSR